MLVSAIMPIADRSEMGLEAVYSFLRQTWPEKELVIIDDGEIPFQGWLGTLQKIPSIRYFCFPPFRMSIGLKRNIACEFANGEYIMHWDSDDIYADDRIEAQMEMVIGKPGVRVAGWRNLKFQTPEGRQYMYSGPPYTAVGATLLYQREWWLTHPFECRSEGEDTSFAFQAANAGRLLSDEGSDRIIARLHSGNTSQKDLTGRNWKEL